MASKELRLMAESSTTESSSDDEQHDTSMEEEQQDTSMEEEQQDTSMEDISPRSMPPKMRIKLKISRSPPKAAAATSRADGAPPVTQNRDEYITPAKQRDVTENGAAQDATSSQKMNDGMLIDKADNAPDVQDTTATSRNENDTEGEEVVQATVVNSSEEGEVDVHVKVEPAAKPVTSSSARSSGPKKRAPHKPSLPLNARSVRLPPLSSPGMLIPPTPGVYRGDADANGYTTPASVFDHCMSLAGYSTEARTKKPHRGSSVRRQVGDMFDSNVSCAINFPPLVPSELWSLPKKKDQENGKPEPPLENGQEAPRDINHEEEKKEGGIQRDAAQLLLRSLAPTGGSVKDSTSETSRKRRRPWQFSEMVPLSLTLPYPESYIQKRLRYAEKVKERERAIVVSQEATHKYEDAQERYEMLANAKRSTEPLPPPPVPPEPALIPPIPEPVSPPRLSEMEGFQSDGLDDSKHPIYLPKTHEKFTAHLDPACFEITDGRYFNIMTNSIADPNFVGPSAPGIAGLTVAGGSSLATAYSGGGNAGGSALNAAFHGHAGGGNSATTAGPNKSAGSKGTKKKSAGKTAATTAAGDTASRDEITLVESSPTSTSTALKKMMDDGGNDAEEMRNAIIRAAVYASRVGNHSMPFLGTSGDVFPDVGKAFAAHAGIRPCSRCKNNKQGAYHCRLRRKHKGLDYDGGNSPAVLAPLFQEPLADLLLTK